MQDMQGTVHAAGCNTSGHAPRIVEQEVRETARLNVAGQMVPAPEYLHTL